MKQNLLLISTFLFIAYSVCGQGYTNRNTIGKKEAILFVNESTKNTKHYLVKYSEKKLVTDSAEAVKIAETILFKVIGENEIINQRPYEVYFISDFWYIRGTTVKENGPPTMLGGGQFNIIIDSYDSKVVLLSQDE